MVRLKSFINFKSQFETCPLLNNAKHKILQVSALGQFQMLNGATPVDGGLLPSVSCIHLSPSSSAALSSIHPGLPLVLLPSILHSMIVLRREPPLSM